MKITSGKRNQLNPLVTNRFSHPYQMGESISIIRGIRGNFSFLFHFSMKILYAYRIAPDGTPSFAASRLGLICLPMSHKKDARLIWVKIAFMSYKSKKKKKKKKLKMPGTEAIKTQIQPPKPRWKQKN